MSEVLIDSTLPFPLIAYYNDCNIQLYISSTAFRRNSLCFETTREKDSDWRFLISQIFVAEARCLFFLELSAHDTPRELLQGAVKSILRASPGLIDVLHIELLRVEEEFRAEALKILALEPREVG